MSHPDFASARAAVVARQSKGASFDEIVTDLAAAHTVAELRALVTDGPRIRNVWPSTTAWELAALIVRASDAIAEVDAAAAARTSEAAFTATLAGYGITGDAVEEVYRAAVAVREAEGSIRAALGQVRDIASRDALAEQAAEALAS